MEFERCLVMSNIAPALIHAGAYRIKIGGGVISYVIEERACWCTGCILNERLILLILG